MTLQRPVPRLHVLTDRARGHHPLALVAAAIQGGADLVQIREKGAEAAALSALVASAVARCRGTGVRVLVNDAVDVAVAARADGAHVGHGDLDPWEARRRLGPGALLGATANDAAELDALADAPVDYVGVGPVFGTVNKANPAPTLGIDGFAALVRRARVPVIAIGGIRAEDIPALLDAGAWGVAVIGAVTASSRPPAEAVAELRETMARSVRGREQG